MEASQIFKKIDRPLFTKTSIAIMSSVENFKSAVVRIRDILRGPGMSITGMDSMRHICLYLLSRYMTKDKVPSLGVPIKFAWENLIETAQTKNGGTQKALDYFFHAEGDCLVRHFDRLFGTDKFSFDIKNIVKHKEILEILNGIKMEDVDCQMDILGWVYEQHLKTGSSAARDLGQFFTDRFICEYMVNLCEPEFKGKGVPESVCDPSMGTGGFLTAFMKYYKNKYPKTPIDWSVQQKEIHGCDTDPKVAGVARLNLFMESGGNRFNNILTHDSLYGDLTQTGYDVILANMPFGLKGIKHAECCERVNKLKIRGTKSEPLFLQLMMVSLNLGGRCAVVVPDGMLVNQSSCHNDTRKYLLDKFELKRVIKMKGQFFMNTGIQPSILFFENTGKPTKNVEFWDVIKGDKGNIQETMMLSVPREKIDDASSLDMRRYQETDKVVANPAGYKTLKLGDLFEVKGGKAISKVNLTGTLYPYYGCNGINGHVDEFLFDGEYIVCAQDGSIGSVYLLNEKFYPSNHTHILKTKDATKISNAYGAYFLKMNVDWKSLTTSVIPKVTQGNLLKIKIIVPPIEIQQEIVATLDRIYAPGTTELAETLKLTDKVMDLVLANPSGAMLEPIVEAQRLIRKSAQMVADVKAQMVADVKAQMVAVMRSVNMRGFEMKKLDEVCKFVGGKGNYEKDGDAYPYYDSNGITGTRKDYLHDGDYIITARKMSIGAVHYATGKFWASDNTIVMTSNDTTKLNNRFLYYWLLMNNDILKAMTSGIKPGIRKSDVIEIKMPIPPIDFQLSVLKRMDDLESQQQALIALGKKSEDNAHFILDSYLNTA
jgi:restriction endonuclease S subunit